MLTKKKAPYGISQGLKFHGFSLKKEPQCQIHVLIRQAPETRATREVLPKGGLRRSIYFAIKDDIFTVLQTWA